MLLLEGETLCRRFDWPEDSGVEYAVTPEGVCIVAGRCFVRVVAGRDLTLLLLISEAGRGRSGRCCWKGRIC